jgi:hypothetical protein
MACLALSATEVRKMTAPSGENRWMEGQLCPAFQGNGTIGS